MTAHTNNQPNTTPLERFCLIDIKRQLQKLLECCQIQQDRISQLADHTTCSNDQWIDTIESACFECECAMVPIDFLANTKSNSSVQAVMREAAQRLQRFYNCVWMNNKLYTRAIVMLTDDDLSSEQKHLLRTYQLKFKRHGVDLCLKDQNQLIKINEKLLQLQYDFRFNLLASNQNDVFWVPTEAECDGMSTQAKKEASDRAKQLGYKTGFVFTLDCTTDQKLLNHLRSRNLRNQLLSQSLERAHNTPHDNSLLVIQILKWRSKKASLFGFKHWADYCFEDRIAPSPKKVLACLKKVTSKVMKLNTSYAQAIQDDLRSQGINGPVSASDWINWCNKQQTKSIDQTEQGSHDWKLDQILEKGIFYSLKQLYGISFHLIQPDDVYGKDMKIYQVREEDGQALGYLLTDYRAHTGKRQGAWMSSLQSQSKRFGTQAWVSNHLNLKPDDESSLTLDAIRTLFHEIGHAIHGLFSEVSYPSISGTHVALDCLECPSIAHEDWMYHPKIMANMLEDKEDMDAVMVRSYRIRESQKFKQAYHYQSYCAASILDLECHMLTQDQLPKTKEALEALEHHILHKYGFQRFPIPPRYRLTYFAHLFSSEQYSAGYYAYLWSEIIASEVFEKMSKCQDDLRPAGEKFRREWLCLGNSKDLTSAMESYLGRKPSMDALWRRHGLHAG
ncbi:MAG: M3 family metallopeptidase [Pseudomonadota bacterium]|nr:M3 family metallopeptidase [Pseudomonadota bacterium]